MTSMRVAPALLALLAATLLITPPALHADELQQARQSVKLGRTFEALQQVNRYLLSHPKNAQARFLKGLILTDQNKTKEAIKVFSDLTRDYPELPEPYNNLAVLYASRGEYKKAKFALETAIRTHPSYATAQENLGDIYAKMASRAYDKALQLDKTNTAAKTKLALIKNIFTPHPLETRQQLSAGSGKVATANRTKITPRAKPHKTPLAGPAPTPAAKNTPARHSAPAPQTHAAQSAKGSRVATAGTKTAAHKRPKKAAAKVSAASEKRALLKAVHAWAKAWSNKDVKAYLAAYAHNFKPPRGEKRARWAKIRKQRITAPKFIHVSIVAPKVRLMGSARATVSFKQVYRSNTLKTLNTRKTLALVKSGDKWLIVEERIGR